MKKILPFVILAAALAVASPLAAQPLAAAGADGADRQADLLAEGWTLVHEGVLQKQQDDGRLSPTASKAASGSSTSSSPSWVA